MLNQRRAHLDQRREAEHRKQTAQRAALAGGEPLPREIIYSSRSLCWRLNLTTQHPPGTRQLSPQTKRLEQLKSSQLTDTLSKIQWFYSAAERKERERKGERDKHPKEKRGCDVVVLHQEHKNQNRNQDPKQEISQPGAEIMEIEAFPGFEGTNRKAENAGPKLKFKGGRRTGEEVSFQACPHRRPPNMNAATLDSLQTLPLFANADITTWFPSRVHLLTHQQV